MISNIRWVLAQGRLLRQDFSNFESRVKLPASNSHGFTVTYNSDGMTLLNSSECLDKEEFVRAYEASLNVNDWRGVNGEKMDMRWRYYVVLHYANTVKDIPGDFGENRLFHGRFTYESSMKPVTYYPQTIIIDIQLIELLK